MNILKMPLTKAAVIIAINAVQLICGYIGLHWMYGYFVNGDPHPVAVVLNFLGRDISVYRPFDGSLFDIVRMGLNGFSAVGIYSVLMLAIPTIIADVILGVVEHGVSGYLELSRKRRIPTTEEVGRLVSVTVNTGNSEYHTTTTIATEGGFYVVRGRTAPLKAGSTVRLVDGWVEIENGEDRKQRYELKQP